MCCQNLKRLYRSLTGFSHGFSTDGLKNTLVSQGCVLETALKPEGLQAAGRRDLPGWPASHDLATNPAAAVMESGFPRHSAIFQ